MLKHFNACWNLWNLGISQNCPEKLKWRKLREPERKLILTTKLFLDHVSQGSWTKIFRFFTWNTIISLNSGKFDKKISNLHMKKTPYILNRSNFNPFFFVIPGCCPFQDCKVWKNQVPCHCAARFHWDLRLGPQTLPQVYGLQVIQWIATQAPAGWSHRGGGHEAEGT